MTTDLMIDIETLSNATNAHVVSVGLVWFDKDHPDETLIPAGQFYPTEDQPLAKIDVGTVKFWLEQTPKAQRVITDERNRDSAMAVSFVVRDAVEQARRVWAKDPDFDCVILKTFMKNAGLIYQWPFWKNRSVRTILDIVPNVKDLPFEGVQHDALADAVYQARQMQEAYKWLNTRT
jgi:hypothetical protein